MLKLKDESIAVYKDDYRPIELFKNGKKIHGFQTVGMSGNEALFENTYNDSITVYGKSAHAHSLNLCPPPDSDADTYEEGDVTYNWSLTAKENGYFDYSGCMATGRLVTKATLQAGTYTVSGCELLYLWWSGRDDFLELPATFTIDNTTEVQVYLWHANYKVLTLENQYIQIEKGETATEYSPYVGNSDFAVSPDNARKIIHASGEIRVEGGNLLPPDFGIFSNWKLQNDAVPTDGYIFELDLIPGEYLLRFNVEDKIPPNGDYGYLYIQESTDCGETYKTVYYPMQYINVLKSLYFTVKENCLYRFWAWCQMGVREELFSNWFLQRKAIPEGSYPYSPVYRITCPALEGIELDESQDYNYCEEINNQKHYYISNILSGGLLKRNVGEAVITGQENFGQKETESETLNCYYCDISYIIQRARAFDKFLCNYFEASDITNVGAVLGQNDTKLYFYVEKSKFPTLADFVDWVKTVYQKAEPMCLYYILDAQLVEQSELEVPLRAYPMCTYISLKNSGEMSLGISSCIKAQNKGDN